MEAPNRIMISLVFDCLEWVFRWLRSMIFTASSGIYRGAPVSQEEKKRLNELGAMTLNEAGLDFEEYKDSDWIRKTTGQMGYAHYYLDKCWDDSRRKNEADAIVYQKLVDIDSELGMDASQQLFCCLWSTTRSDIIKNIDFERVNGNESLKKKRFDGFANLYLFRCKKESGSVFTRSDEKIDVEIYSKLVELDTRLGTTGSELLFGCLLSTTRPDIIKIIDFDQVKQKKNIAFAEVYLFQSLKNNTFDIEVYKQLMALDSKLGATAAEQLLGCMFYTLRLDIIKLINIEKVDFGFVGRDGLTIYRNCFRFYMDCRFTQKKPKEEWSKIVAETEEIFDFLVTEGNKNGFNVDSILEIPDSSGATCFSIASDCSKKICNYIIERGIQVNNIKTTMMIPQFTYPELAIKMMENGINPYVIDCNGNSPVETDPSSFETEEAKQLLATFQRSVHYSIEDIDCKEWCPADCPSKFKKFFCKNGSLVEMKSGNKIGSGGFGMVFRELFHGEPMAMKCMLMGKMEERDYVKQAVSDFEKNISELRIQIATMGSGVIVPVAFVRQQNQEQDENGKWIAKNYNIYIYPLYDCNLEEFHKNYYEQFTEEIVADIINQCFIRNG